MLIGLVYDEGCEINPLYLLNLTAEDYRCLKNKLLKTVLPEEKQDTRVQKILDHALEEVKIYEPQLRGLAVAGILYGSLYFGDPSDTPDIDLILAYCGETDNLDNITLTIHNELQDFSEEYQFCGFTLNLKDYRENMERIIRGEYWMDTLGHVFESDSLLISRIIPLDFCDTEQVVACIEDNRKYADEIALQYPFFRAMLIWQFYRTWSQRFNRYRPVRDMNDTTKSNFFEEYPEISDLL